MNIRAKARIQITIEVDADGAWGHDCSIGQLHTQAMKETRDKIISKLRNEGVAPR